MDSSSLSDLLAIYDYADGPLQIALLTVAILIIIVAIISIGVSIYLAISYRKYNKMQNSANISGEAAARRILDENGLENIKIATSGSLMFGNSYSHYFKKVRLRRRTVEKTSIASLAMGSQKAALAVLDKEGDPDMRKRVRMIPIISFGPFAFIPLIIIGVVIDVLVFNASGWSTIIASIAGIAFYAFSLFLSFWTLRTEKKAQERTYVLLREDGLATENEIDAMHKLFRLYNIQYINDIILSFLELLYYILQAVATDGKSFTK